MGDILLALLIPLLMCSSGLYALAESWWRRRHPRAEPVPYLREPTPPLVAQAEAIVADTYQLLAPLYDTSGPPR
ncbi:hypothetical protein [Streptomyces lavendofoliae]|uniref:Uncharacterized protein n=1 Tax=Streptomyces lavendofoliae TaxID=67314 RepID=A0A918I2G3_9ACTN|nr:hypothetical protein [Streptomyces lavendofoliae]GGU61953.1 hypothetical protein GCM10010274_58400 [Streptomyces lavendofoliae]